LFESVAATSEASAKLISAGRQLVPHQQYFLPVLNGSRRADMSESRANAVKPLMVVASQGATGDPVG
jgi:hypothetical protein